MIVESFGLRLRALLKEKRLTKQALARQVHVTPSAVKRWLSGSIPNRAPMHRLAEALQVAPQWLECGVGERNSEAIAQRQEEELATPSLSHDAHSLAERRKRILENPFAEYAQDAREATKVFDDWLWFFNRRAAEAESRAEEYRQKIEQAVSQREKRREEVVLWHRLLATAADPVGKPRFFNLPATFDDLLERIRLSTMPRGKKKALADFLGISHSQLGGWLSTKKSKKPRSKPAGETTLRMLAWLGAEEEKAMRRGRARRA